MQAVLIRETGTPEVLHYEQADRPEPGDGQVLIRVHAASVNPADWKARRGLSQTLLPAVLGRDVSGTVELSRADGFAEGDDVFGYVAGIRGVRDRLREHDREEAARSEPRAGRRAAGGRHDRVAGAVRPRRARTRADRS